MADLSLNLDFAGGQSGGGLSKRENKKHQQFLKRRKYLERRGFLRQKQLPPKLANKNPGAGQQQQKPNSGDWTNQNAQSVSHSQKAQKSNVNFFHQQGAPNNADHAQKKPPINLFQSHQQGAAQSAASATPTPKGLANGHTPAAKDQPARPSPQLPSPASLLSEFASGIQPSHKIVAIDCEMVGTGPKGSVSALARCSIVTYHGDIIYDKYIKPAAPVTDYRTRWSGIRREHLARAVPFATAQKEILKILQGKTVIGHAIQNDYKALGYFHPQELTRDTSKIPALNRKAGFPEKELASLKRLAKQLLHKDIQTGRGGHCSVEDAKTTMQLYRVVEEEHERELAAGRGH